MPTRIELINVILAVFFFGLGLFLELLRSKNYIKILPLNQGTMSLVENRALVEVRATSGVTLLPRGTTARPSPKSSKKQELNPDSHATESATECLPATSSVRQRWSLAGVSLGGITAQRAR